MQITVRKSQKNTLKSRNLLLLVIANKMTSNGASLKDFKIWRHLYLNSHKLKICISRKTLSKKFMVSSSSINVSIKNLKENHYLKITRRRTNTGKCLSSEITVTLPASLIAELEKTKQLNYLTKEFML